MNLNTKPLATAADSQSRDSAAGSCAARATCAICNGSRVISTIKEGQVVGTSPCVCAGGMMRGLNVSK